MKTGKLIILGLLLSLNVLAQPIISKKDLAPLLIQSSLCFTAGISRGTVETLDNSFGDFQRTFPGIDAKKWNPDYTWLYKYKNNDPTQGKLSGVVPDGLYALQIKSTLYRVLENIYPYL